MPFPAAALKTKLQLLRSELIIRPSFFREALLYDYTRQTLVALSNMVEHETDDEALQLELKTYLRSRWQLVKGTMLSYTAIPDSDITDLFIEIAENLSEAERRDTDSEHYSMALSILMPGVAVESTAPTQFPDLDEASLNLKTILKTHILGRDGNYLIPVSLLIKKMDIAPSGPLPNVYYDLFAYGHLPDTARTAFTTLNQAEVDRLYAHSALTRRLKDTKEAYSALSKDKTHLLGQCHVLLKQMYFASVGGIGQEEIAASSVYPVMQSFFDYYFALGDKRIARLAKDLKAEITLLHQYFTGEKKADIGSCLTTRREAIQAAMRGHEVLMSQISLSGNKKQVLIAEAKEAFEKARTDLEASMSVTLKQYQGEDRLPITPALIAHTQTPLEFNTYQDAVALINGLRPSDISTLFSMDEVKASLYQALKSMEDWAMLIILFSEDKLKVLLTEIGIDTLTRLLMADMGAFIAFLDILTPIRRDILFDYIDINTKDNDGNTVLIWAVSKRHKEIALALIEHGAKLDEKNNGGNTALILAAKDGHKDIVLALIEQGAKLDEKDYYGSTPLIWAALQGHKDIVLALIKKMTSIDEKNNGGQTALMWAAVKGQKDIVLALIKKGANLDGKDNDGKTALIWAVQNGRKDIVLAFIKKGARLDEKDNDGRTALMWAALQGHKDILLALIKRDVSLNEKDNDGRTVLIWAALEGHKDIVLALIKRDVSLNEKNTKGYTALMWAAAKGQKDIVLALIKKGASLDEKDNGGQTALMWAMQNGRKDIVLALIKKGASLDEKDNGGQTALMWAAEKGQKDIVLALIKKGANVSLQNNEGESALSMAEVQGYSEIVDAISEAKAKQSIHSEATPLPFFEPERPAAPLAADESHASFFNTVKL